MFSWFTKKDTKTPPCFEDSYKVIDLEHLPEDNRKVLERQGCVELCSNTNEHSNWSVFYEIIFTKRPIFRFVVYYSKSMKDAQEMFNSAKVIFNTLAKWFTFNRKVVAERLCSIMDCLRINRNWNCAHVCAYLGTFNAYFKNDLPAEVINHQVKPDLCTPLHLAIKQFNLPTVTLLLSKSPNLDLLNFKKHSVLHYAAVSTTKIATQVLNQEGMFNRILGKDAKGCTALHLACYTQKCGIVFEFLKFGLTVRMLTLSPPNSRPKGVAVLPSDTDPEMQKIVSFSLLDLMGGIDSTEFYGGGCPLHWVMPKQLTKKMLNHSFPINTRNCNGESCLHVAAKKRPLKNILMILCKGANVNAVTLFGNTPLHMAVKKDDVAVPQSLIAFDANIDARNYNNESVRHVAAKSCTTTGSSKNNEAILYLLSALGAKRCPPPKTTGHEPDTEKACSNGCSFNGDFEGSISKKLNDAKEKYDKICKNYVFEEILEKKESRTAEEIAAEKGVNMLCLDGGGIKGMVTIQMLIELERYLKHPLVSYFKWLAGTSTGSFICAFLIKGVPLKEIRSIYFRFKNKVLAGTKPYSDTLLEKVVRDVVGELTMNDVLTKYGKYLFIPSGIGHFRPMKLHIFRSYPSIKELFEESGDKRLLAQVSPDLEKGLKNYRTYESRYIEVWKACRASGSAPTFFKPHDKTFIDGGLIANNPTVDVLSEFHHYNAALNACGRKSECQKLEAVVSFGTGSHSPKEISVLDVPNSLVMLIKIKQLIHTFLEEATQTNQHIVDHAQSMCLVDKAPYFRLNAFISEKMELDERNDLTIIQWIWETKRYMFVQRDQVKMLADYLEKCTLGWPAKALNRILALMQILKLTPKLHQFDDHPTLLFLKLLVRTMNQRAHLRKL